MYCVAGSPRTPNATTTTSSAEREHLRCYSLQVSFYREGKVSIGIGLILEGKVPPLGVKGLEAVAQHGLTQYHAVL